MKARAPRLLVGLTLICCMLALVAVAQGVTAPNGQSLGGVEHRWVTQQMGYAPYTEQVATERNSKAAAEKALVAPPIAIVKQADRDYPGAVAAIALAKKMKGTVPVITGHEVIVWNGKKAARLYVDNAGLVKVLEVGAVRPLLVAPLDAAADQGDRDAIEIAKGAFTLAGEMNGNTPVAEGALVAAHGVGFAKKDGSHLVVRVGMDGTTTYPDW